MALARLNCGLDASIFVDALPQAMRGRSVEQALRVGQTVRAVVVAIDMNRFTVRLSLNEDDFRGSCDAGHWRRHELDPYFDSNIEQEYIKRGK